jgi:dethiobiotin synthetase
MAVVRWLVAGTDTDVGKTAATAALAAGFRASGRVVLAAKPIASGVHPGSPAPDAVHLARAAGHGPWVRYRYRSPISPHRAQLVEGVTVDWSRLVADLAALTPDVLLVEAAGGWRSPLAVDLDGILREARDLARALQAVPLLVASDRLGCIHQVRATAEVMTTDGTPPAALILNRGAAPPDPSRPTNRVDLEQMISIPIVTLPAFSLDDPSSVEDCGLRLIADLRDAGLVM